MKMTISLELSIEEWRRLKAVIDFLINVHPDNRLPVAEECLLKRVSEQLKAVV